MNMHATLVRLALIALTVLALVSRLAGIDFLLPHQADPLKYLTMQTEYLWSGGDPKEAQQIFHWYPSMTAHLLALTPPPGGADDAGDLEEELSAAGAPYLRTRIFVALISILAIPGTFFLARRFLGPGPSLLAAAFMATSLLHLTYASQARLHGVQTSLALLAVLAAMRLTDRASMGNYLLAGVAAAAAIGSLHNGVFVLPALLTAHWFRERGSASKWRAVLPLLLVALAYYWFYPFGVEQEGARQYTDLTVRDGMIEMGPQRMNLQNFRGEGFGWILHHLWTNDPLMLVFGLIGAFFFAKRFARVLSGNEVSTRNPALVALAYALPHLLVLCVWETHFARFFLPLMPFVACAAAYAATCIYRAAMPPKPVVGALVAGLLIAFPAYVCVRLCVLRVVPDTMEQAASWLAENTDPADGRILLSPHLHLPLFYDDRAIEKGLAYPMMTTGMPHGSIWLLHQSRMGEVARQSAAYPFFTARGLNRRTALLTDPEKARKYVGNARYAVLQVVENGAETFPPLGELHAAIRSEGTRVAHFFPRAEIERNQPGFDYQDPPHAIARVLGSSSLGPAIEIYRLDP